MRIAATLLFVAILGATISLSAEEKSGEGSRVPDPAAFKDLLYRGGDLAAPKKAPLSTPKERPAESHQEIDRVLAEARMHLSRIADESKTCSEDARNVFDEAIELIRHRLESLKKKPVTGKKASGEIVPPVKAEAVVKEAAKPDSGQPIEAESVSPVSGKRERAPGEKAASSRSSRLLRLAGRLRALAEELEAEATPIESAGN